MHEGLQPARVGSLVTRAPLTGKTETPVADVAASMAGDPARAVMSAPLATLPGAWPAPPIPRRATPGSRSSPRCARAARARSAISSVSRAPS
ncbi:MAG: hypothetical protein FJ027_02660 [Candidatus Rokubacteria bacterium]|nr:hypothetical protein [Candidatus Rokubacteria bacterium]